MVRGATALVLLAVASTAAAADYASRSDVEQAARAAADAAALYADEAALTAALLQAQTRSVIEPLSSEARLVQLLQRLREVAAPLPATRQAVAGLLDHAPQTLTDPIDPEQRGLQRPAFAVAGTARAVLQRWEQTTAEAAVRDALARGDMQSLRTAMPAALAAVIAVADDSDLAAIRDAAPADAHVQRVLFERLADPALALDLLQQHAAPEGLRLIARIDTVLSAEAAHGVLTDARLDPGYASAARLALGRLAATHAPARRTLLDTLGDAQGASSASALARVGDSETLAALAGIVRTAPDGQRLRHALLALRLSDAAPAKSELSAFVTDATRPAKLRDEVRAWLR